MLSTHYSCQILNTLEFSWWSFEKSLNIKFHWQPSCSLWIDTTKLTVTFCNFAHMPKNTRMEQEFKQEWKCRHCDSISLYWVHHVLMFILVQLSMPVVVYQQQNHIQMYTPVQLLLRTMWKQLWPIRCWMDAPYVLRTQQQTVLPTVGSQISLQQEDSRRWIQVRYDNV